MVGDFRAGFDWKLRFGEGAKIVAFYSGDFVAGMGGGWLMRIGKEEIE